MTHIPFKILLLLFLLGGILQAVPSKPNILLIFTDDLDFEEITAFRKFGDAALAGNSQAHPQRVLTPHMDRLARESLIFTQFHVASTVCTPSRYALLTGQLASRSASVQAKYSPEVTANIEFNTDIEKGQWYLTTALQTAGYTTGISGKWHNMRANRGNFTVKPPIADSNGVELGPQDPLLPENVERIRRAYGNGIRLLTKDLGWDFASSIYMGNAFELGLPKTLSRVENNMEWATAGAVKFLDQQKDSPKPFFLFFAPNVPHGGGDAFLDSDPRATPEGLVDWHLGSQPSRGDIRRRTREVNVSKNAAWATWLDDGIGAILKKLDDLGLSENTLVIFSSDQQTRGKWTCYEGARVPLAIRWPGRIKPGRSDALLSSIDVVPTVLQAAGGNLPAAVEAIVDGRSFMPLLEGAAMPERPVLIEMGHARAIISGGWKYIATRQPEKVKQAARKTGKIPSLQGNFPTDIQQAPVNLWPSFGSTDELFDLSKDPMEQHNLAADPAFAEKLAAMRTLLKQVLAPLPNAFAEFKIPLRP
jgi:arylsulfatase A-like enzyme